MKEVYTKEGRKYNQLTAEERGKIEAYWQQRFSVSAMSREMKRSKSTIFQEIHRGKYNGKYQAHIAQNRAMKRRKESHKHTKWTDYNLLIFIQDHLRKCWSPEIISMEWRRTTGKSFSHTSIYKLIREHRPEWRKYLINKGKQRKLKHAAGKQKISDRIGIEQRPKIIGARERFGDFEADTVISSRGGKACLAVFVERQSRMYFIEKMRDKSAAEMLSATLRALRKYNVKSITYDNGTENAAHIEANNLLKCNSYFCSPYHSWEKGQIENRNKILRQFLPKGTNFDLISEDDIRTIQNMINHRPMKVLDWNSPSDVFSLLRSGY